MARKTQASKPVAAAAKRTRTAAPATAPATETPRPFAIVAIGASAGGLDALEQFLGHVPAGSGMAFVVIQHLDPNHKGMMPELCPWCRRRTA